MICTNMVCIMCDMTQCGMYGMLYISQREGGGKGLGPKMECFCLDHRLSFFFSFSFFFSLTSRFHKIFSSTYIKKD